MFFVYSCFFDIRLVLTIIAGAAVAPAMGEIDKAFSGESQIMIKLILCCRPPEFVF
ncbi:hypothetical protein [Sporomusa sp. KB1]|uniref:hypothetical protein n=1 Tax=Sporomusa sp. KB1 TaxID=943346 RepID=UPI001C97AE37|nr:hypothetical protein [Sporomusa sp. KB1]